MTTLSEARQYVYQWKRVHSTQIPDYEVICFKTNKMIKAKPGLWYFFNECYDSYGIFKTEMEAAKACKKYIESLK